MGRDDTVAAIQSVKTKTKLVMALQIKEGVEILAYGPTSKPFTKDSNLSQEILEHLQTRFPDEIEEVKTKHQTIKTK